MTLHKVTELAKKIGIGGGLAIGVILVIVLLFQAGIFIKNIIAPPQAVAPNMAFGLLPAIQFPESEIDNELTYTLNTITGTLPMDFPDRLHVYRTIKPSPNLLNLEKAKTKVAAVGITDDQGNVVPEISLGNGEYEWSERKELRRRLKFNIVSFDFSLNSGFLTNLTVRGAQNLPDQSGAVETAKSFLEELQLLPEDVDLTKTKNPKLFSIQGNALAPTTSLSNAQVIRVDIFQKDIEYDLDTGLKDAEKVKLKMPIAYPEPPFSTMSLWVASGLSQPEVVMAEFHRQEVDTSNVGVYPIKTPDEAFSDLQNGKGYIASYQGLDNQVLINNVYLAYYMGKEKQDYLMPVMIFEGQDEFIAYVAAIRDEATN